MSFCKLTMGTLPIALLVVLHVVMWTSATPTHEQTCRCVPDQWEGLLMTTDHEFDLRGERTATMDTNMLVHYDFKNKKFAMVDIKTGSKAIADYSKGRKYIVRKGRCRETRAPPAMREMCLPENAASLGRFRLDGSVAVQMWRFAVPYNLSMETVVATPSCVPITEKIYVRKNQYATLTTSMYLDVSLGISDPAIFQPPTNCARSRRPDMPVDTLHKRSQAPYEGSFTDWMKEEVGDLD